MNNKLGQLRDSEVATTSGGTQSKSNQGMSCGVVYVKDGYSDKHNCYFVKEVRNGTPTYLFKAYIRGNTATLYPHKPLYTTELRRDKLKLSIFDIK